VSDRGRFERQDIFTGDLREATVVTLYLTPEFNERLRPRLQSELPAGTRIVSQTHPMAHWRPVKRIEVTVDGIAHAVYLWIVGR